MQVPCQAFLPAFSTVASQLLSSSRLQPVLTTLQTGKLCAAPVFCQDVSVLGMLSHCICCSFGTSVGSGALTLRRALLIAAFCEFTGAVTLGAGVRLLSYTNTQLSLPCDSLTLHILPL